MIIIFGPYIAKTIPMKNLYTLAVLALILNACSGHTYEINGTIEAIADGTVLLERIIDGQYSVVDSTTISNGQFSFSGTLENPDLYFLSVVGKRGKALMFLENSEITVTAHADTIWTARIQGSTVQDEFLAFQEELQKIAMAGQELYNRYREAMSNGDQVLAGSLEGEVNASVERINAFQLKFIAENPSSCISPVILSDMSQEMDVAELETHLNKLDPSLDGNSFVIQLRTKTESLNRLAIGKIAPDFTQNDTEGNPVTLSSLRGNYLLIDFWAAWCSPCRLENPNIVAAYERFHDKGFDIIGVSLDRSKEDWLNAIERDNLTWTQVSDLKYWGNEAAQLYGVNSIPSNFLLDREGKIIFKGLRGKALHTELEKLLSE
jgi:peroxiredoxin